MKQLFFLILLISLVAPAFAGPKSEACVASLAEYDKLMSKRSGGTLAEADSVAMVDHLRSALEQFKESIADGEEPDPVAAKAIGTHYNDYTVAGIFMFQDRDYRGAYDIWEACVSLPDIPDVNAAVTNPQNSRGELAFNRALAATQAGLRQETLEAYDKAYSLGYEEAQLFDGAINMAQQMKQNEIAYMWSDRAQQKFGMNSLYREYMIKSAMEMDTNRGVALATESIEADPANPKWYTLRVIGYERLKDHSKSIEDLRKVSELAPQDAMAQYNYAAKLMFLANMARNEHTADKKELKKMYDEAAVAFEKVCTLPADSRASRHAIEKSLNYLDQIFYSNGDKAGRKRVETYRKALNNKV